MNMIIMRIIFIKKQKEKIWLKNMIFNPKKYKNLKINMILGKKFE